MALKFILDHSFTKDIQITFVQMNSFRTDKTETSCFVVGRENGFSYFSRVITPSLYEVPSRHSLSLLRVLFLTQKKKNALSILWNPIDFPIGYTLSSPSAILSKTGVRLTDVIAQHKPCGTL